MSNRVITPGGRSLRNGYSVRRLLSGRYIVSLGRWSGGVMTTIFRASRLARYLNSRKDRNK
jgi:hypothetical protein